MRSIRVGLTAMTLLVFLAGCYDDTVSPRDGVPPAAPRGLFSVTGDTEATLHWVENTEADLAGYRVYESPCASGPGCPYDLVGITSGTSFTVDQLTNGQTRYFAVAAVDHAGNESDLSYEDVFDTPRPEGSGLLLNNYAESASASGYDFSAFVTRAWDHPETDVFYGFNGTVHQMFVPDFATNIQDAGYASSLDAVDFAPTAGWSPTGTVELITGHCYVVWLRDDHYAKFRVVQIRPGTSSTPARVVLDWAYQTDPGNRELKQQPVSPDKPTGRRPIAWIR